MRVRLPAQPELRDYVRFGTLASNSHNTQPWKFRLGADTIDILPDFSRRTPIVDPDDHHLYVTLGCAAQNVVIAANASRRPAELSIATDACQGTAIQVLLGKGLGMGHSPDADLCSAIPVRQSTRSEYDGQALSGPELRQLEKAAARPGVDVLVITERPRLEQALELIQKGNSAQMDSPAFVCELKKWIRYNPAAALTTGDGLLGKCSGNPSAPNWLGPMVFDLAFKKDAENKKYARQVRSSAGLAVFVAEKENPEGWIQVGLSFERFALQATVLGIRHAHLNMPIEVPEVRPAFADWLGIPGRRPDLVVRFGRALPMPMSVRRPLNAVIVH
jgi:nitroreductase